MVDVTRFPGGMNNLRGTDAFGEMPMSDMTRHIYFWEDFIDSGDFIAATPVDWTVTAVGAGTRTRPALLEQVGGVVLLTNAAADNDSVSVQQISLPYLFNRNLKSAFQARFKISEVLQSDVFMGLSIADTTPIGAAGSEPTGVEDGIFFMKIDGSALLRVFVRADTVTTFSDTDVGTLVDNTYVNVGWYWDAAGVDPAVHFFVNNTKVAKFAVTAFATNLPDEAMSVNMSIQNGEAVAKTMHVDHVAVMFERAAIGPFIEF